VSGILKHKGLSYIGDEDLISRYTMFLEGRRVFDVLVHNGLEVGSAELGEDVEVPTGTTLHRIKIARVDAPADTAQTTKGIAIKKPHFEKNLATGEDGVHTHISSYSVASYVYPRALVLLARLFVPPAA
jgi:hypothetical protein